MLLPVLGIVGGTAAWAAWVYVRAERRHRTAWGAAPSPRAVEPPYRTELVAPTAARRAPGLVRLTAFACIWIGPFATILMVIPMVLFWRGARMTLAVRPGTGHAETADYVHRIAPLLLGRDPRVPFACDAVTPLLRVMVTALIGFGVFLAVLDKPIMAGILVALGAPIVPLYGLLVATRRRWPDPEPSIEAIVEEAMAHRAAEQAADEAKEVQRRAIAQAAAAREARRAEARRASSGLRAPGAAWIACGDCGELTDAAELVPHEGRRICRACADLASDADDRARA